MRIKHSSISMSAMVIGSVSPDVEYFLRMELAGRFGHTAIGVFLLDLPVGVALFFLFHQLVKTTLTDHLPAYFRSRLVSLRNFNAVNYWSDHYIAFLVCLLVGIASHLFWDGLTHERDLMVQKLDFFREPVTISGFPQYPTYRYFQHLSTIFGALTILLVFHFSKRSSIEDVSGIMKFWITLIGTSAILFIARSSIEFDYFGDVVAALIGSLMWGTVIASALFRFLLNGKKEDMGTSRETEG